MRKITGKYALFSERKRKICNEVHRRSVEKLTKQFDERGYTNSKQMDLCNFFC
jgi:hypothetical protein